MLIRPRLVKKTIPQTIDSLGTLTSTKLVNLTSESDGQITKLFFDSGNYVNAGDKVVQLNDNEEVAELKSLQSALELSKSTYRRYQELAKTGAVAAQKLDELKADVTAKESAVKKQEVVVADKTIVAPFYGKLGTFTKQVGSYVKSGDVIVDIYNNEKLKVDYTIDDDLKAKVAIGQPVVITGNTLGKQSFHGWVSFISPTIDKNTQMISLQAAVDNTNDKLSPGLFVNIAQTVSIAENALVVPEQCVLSSLQGDYVYKIVNNRANKVIIKTGIRRQGVVQVLSGFEIR